MYLASLVIALMLGIYMILGGSVYLGYKTRLTGWRVRAAGILLIGSVLLGLTAVFLVSRLIAVGLLDIPMNRIGSSLMISQVVLIALGFFGAERLLVQAKPSGLGHETK